MNARRLAAFLFMVLVACGSPGAATRNPDLRSTGAEAPLAVTVPTGPETLPAWQRQPDGKATLVVPADLLFARDSAALSPAASTVLQQVVAEFGPGRGVLVEGHADSDGDASHNQALSERRATAVADWLVAHGVVRSAVEMKGWGEDRPAVEETDEAAKATNRRVVVTVTSRNTSPMGAAVRPPALIRRT